MKARQVICFVLDLGIIEDISPDQLKEIVEHIDETGIIPQVYDIILEKEIAWNYREFDLEYCNVFFKDNILRIQFAYESYK